MSGRKMDKESQMLGQQSNKGPFYFLSGGDRMLKGDVQKKKKIARVSIFLPAGHQNFGVSIPRSG